MRGIVIIGVLVLVLLLLSAQFGPSPVRGETARSVSPDLSASPLRMDTGTGK